jgi:hypothetical protein
MISEEISRIGTAIPAEANFGWFLFARVIALHDGTSCPFEAHIGSIAPWLSTASYSGREHTSRCRILRRLRETPDCIWWIPAVKLLIPPRPEVAVLHCRFTP